VTVNIVSSSTNEGIVSPAVLVFSNTDWETPKAFTVTGQDDDVQDGDTGFTMTLSTTSSEESFNDIRWQFRMINKDDDVLVAGPQNASATVCTTAEDGTSCVIDVSINAFPAHFTQLVVTASSSDLTEGELDKSELIFTRDTWEQSQNVTITGLDDAIADSTVLYDVLLASVLTFTDTTGSTSKSIMTTAVAAANLDDDEAGMELTQNGNVTNEAGTIVRTFTYKLLSEPVATVAFPCAVSPAEAVCSPATLYVFPSNWQTAQTVIITGKDDDVVDGDMPYTVTLAGVSTDAVYNGLTRVLQYVNTDDDVVGINVIEYGSMTNEGGGTAIIKVTLNSEPTAAVVFTSSTDDFTEGLSNPSIFVLAQDNWKEGKWISVTGMPDSEVDGDMPFLFTVNAIVSDDKEYLALSAQQLTLTNVDKPSNKISVSSSVRVCETSEDHGECPVQINIAGWYFGSTAWDDLPADGSPAPPSTLYQQPMQKVVVKVQTSNGAEGKLYETYDRENPSVRPYGLTTELQWTFTDAACPTGSPTSAPTTTPTSSPTQAPTDAPTGPPTAPTDAPTAAPTMAPTKTPTNAPTLPTAAPTTSPTLTPTEVPTAAPTEAPTPAPAPTKMPTDAPTATPTATPTAAPTKAPTQAPTTPTMAPTKAPTAEPTIIPPDRCWKNGLNFTVYGEDDDLVEPVSASYFVSIVATITMGDDSVETRELQTINAVNADNDAAFVEIRGLQNGLPVDGYYCTETSETGDACSFQLKLGSQPRAAVTFTASVSDETEGQIVSGQELIFDESNWNEGLILTVKGVDDEVVDGDIPYTLTCEMQSADDLYNLNMISLQFGTLDASAQYPYDLRSLSLTNNDNDVSQVSIFQWPSGENIAGQADNTDELGQTSSVRIELDRSEPLASGQFVNITIVNSMPSEVSLSITELYWDADNWGAANKLGFNLTMTGLDDYDNDGDQTVTITLNVTSNVLYYDETPPYPFIVVNSDDDALIANLGLSFGRRRLDQTTERQLESHTEGHTEGHESRRLETTEVQGCQTTEAGGVCSKTYTLAAFISSYEYWEVTWTSSNTAEGTVSSASKTFIASNWDTPFDYTVTGVDDFIDDGDVTYYIDEVVKIKCKVSAGLCLNSGTLSEFTFDRKRLQFTNTDDDTAGLNVQQVACCQTTEAGGSANFDIMLASQPLGPVTLAITSSDLTEGAPSASTITFTAANWNTAQAVAVAGVDDDVYDLNVDYEVHFYNTGSSDPLYATASTFSQTVTMTNMDDDMYSLHVDWVSKSGTNQTNSTVSELGESATYVVRLGSEPKKSTIITAFSKDGSEAEVNPSILVLAADNWREGKEITITGKNDGAEDGDVGFKVEVTAIIGDNEYQNLVDPIEVGLTNIDDPVNKLSVVFNATSCVLEEKGVNCVLKYKLDYWYSGNEYPFKNPFLQAKLTAKTSDLTEAKLVADDGTETDEIEVIFDATNWNTDRFLVVNSVDDHLVDGDKPFQITLSTQIMSEGRNTWSVQPSRMPLLISGTNKDDDKAELTITPHADSTCNLAGGKTSESDDATGKGCKYTVSLASQPAAGAQVAVAFSSNNTLEGAVSTPAAGGMTFTTTNWMTPQLLIVRGVEDECGCIGCMCFEGGSGSFKPFEITVTTSTVDANWASTAPIEMVFLNEDNDLASLDVRQGGQVVGGTVTPVDEMGKTSDFTIALKNAPTADVTVALTVDDSTEIAVSPPQIVFSTSNWASARGVQVRGLDDIENDGDKIAEILCQMSSSDDNYGGDPFSIQIVNYDDDQLQVINTTGTTTEQGAQFTFGLRMRSWRTGFERFTVSVPGLIDGNGMLVGPDASTRSQGTIAQRNTKEGRVTADMPLSNLFFTKDTWNITKIITVTGWDDSLDDGDVDYDIYLNAILEMKSGVIKVVKSGSVSVTNMDDDTSDLQVVQISTHTAERGGPWPGGAATGGTATFTVKPTSEPWGDMRVDLASTDTTEGVLSDSQLVFTPTTWTAAQTVTVTGVDDFVYDYPVPYKVEISSSTISQDTNYRGQQQKELDFVNDDDESIGMIVSKVVKGVNGTTSENKIITAKMFIRLTSQPKDTVLFTVMADDPTEGSTSPNIIAFSDTTWMLPQQVQIVGVDDPELDGSMQYNVNVKTMYTNDPDYGSPVIGMLTETREFVNIDDPTDKALRSCPLGMYGAILSGGVPNCKSCPAGQYSDTTRNVTKQTDCKTCSYGTYQDELGATAETDCTPCPAGQYSNHLASASCLPCANTSYCGVATVLPLDGVDVLDMQTGYRHGWELVSVPQFQKNFTWWDPQYFREDTVITENSVQLLWFFICASVATTVCAILWIVSMRNHWMHNYVRSMDLFSDEHYEDPRPASDDEYSSDEDEDEKEKEDEKEDEEDVPEPAQNVVVQSMKVEDAGEQFVNGIYELMDDDDDEAEDRRSRHLSRSLSRHLSRALSTRGRVAERELAAARDPAPSRSRSDVVPSFVKSVKLTTLHTDSDAILESADRDEKLIIKRYTISGRHYWYLFGVSERSDHDDIDSHRDYYFVESSENTPPEGGWVSTGTAKGSAPNLEVFETILEEKKKKHRSRRTKKKKKGCCTKIFLKCFDKPELHPEDQRTLLGGLATVGYQVTALGLLLAFAVMFIFYNEDVSESIVPQDANLASQVISDISVEVRFLGYTGRCPKQPPPGERYIDRLSLHGTTVRYTAGDIQVEDSGFEGRREVKRQFPTNDANGSVTNYPSTTNATGVLRALRSNGSGVPAASTTPIGLTFLETEISWQERYASRSWHEVGCEYYYVNKNGTSANITNATNGTNAVVISTNTSSSTNATNATYSEQGPVLVVKWKCLGCTLQRLGNIGAYIKGEKDRYAVSASAIEYTVEATPVIPKEKNSVNGVVTTEPKGNVFRGEDATRQRITLMPATYTCDNCNVFGRKAYRIQFASTEIGSTVGRDAFMTASANALSFLIEFSVGSFAFNTEISPKMTFLNALCELGGMFGAIAAMYISTMMFIEQNEKMGADKLEKIVTAFVGQKVDKVEKMGSFAYHAAVDGVDSNAAPVAMADIEKSIRLVSPLTLDSRVRVQGSMAPRHRALNGLCGRVGNITGGDGQMGHHQLEVRMEHDGCTYTILRRYLELADDADTSCSPPSTVAEAKVDAGEESEEAVDAEPFQYEKAEEKAEEEAEEQAGVFHDYDSVTHPEGDNTSVGKAFAHCLTEIEFEDVNNSAQGGKGTKGMASPISQRLVDLGSPNSRRQKRSGYGEDIPETLDILAKQQPDKGASIASWIGDVGETTAGIHTKSSAKKRSATKRGPAQPKPPAVIVDESQLEHDFLSSPAVPAVTRSDLEKRLEKALGADSPI
jgi:hypothetical protein